ncbi:LOW QUALITY PROTEIN: E3 ubiquitin-protein ligase RNF25 [Notolabrus celidotus]|uniref:LOW QUALITY PROTEIN: E3 ubiquitin-protein ligase RNF25 n=1 Tax=Notolabrus celidotus TaxID=1203425 RepID=UPI00148F7270|nr:LOW QUALITY PROTEIN: E3 ubiquitin-protein ligase RNF25 [Notolabrus celidotus]
MMAAECDVLSEIEVLQSIYLDELQVNRREDGSWEVSLVLYPSTAEDSVSQFVRLTLTLTLDQQYPSSSPDISIHKPRGLSDPLPLSVQKCLQLEAQSCLGSPVLYQLIEKAKEILTESNIPYGNCVICLYGFKEGETFTKTSCYHYFHCHCLGRYVLHSESELRQREKELEEDKTRDGSEHQELTVVCPVCRETLAYDVDQLLASPAPQLPELDEAAIGSSFQQKWFELQKILERPEIQGGIIDPEVESNRFLIHITETKAQGNHGQQGNVESCQTETGTGREVHELKERPVFLGDQEASEAGFPKDAADSAGGRGHPGRRRGPYRPVPHTGAPGPAHHHWDGRAPRSRGGANNQYSRGGGPRRGHGRGYYRAMERDRGREEVL